MFSAQKPLLISLRTLALCGVAALCLSACATNRASPTMAVKAQDLSGMSRGEAQTNLAALAESYKKNPKNRATVIHFAAALRAEGEADQASAVLEDALKVFPRDIEIRVAYAKALTAAGRFEQSLSVLDNAIDPAAPDWNALSVKGAVLDQMGRNSEARALYKQALLVAPQEASLEANLGLSFAMTNELDTAEMHLRNAVRMRGATSQIRQNLALVVGLQGRFDESRAMFSAELSPDQVEANMAYIRALLTQQNRWDVIKEGGEG